MRKPNVYDYFTHERLHREYFTLLREDNAYRPENSFESFFSGRSLRKQREAYEVGFKNGFDHGFSRGIEQMASTNVFVGGYYGQPLGSRHEQFLAEFNALCVKYNVRIQYAPHLGGMSFVDLTATQQILTKKDSL